MNEYLVLSEQRSNVANKIYEMMGKPYNDVDWEAIKELERKKTELEAKMDKLSKENKMNADMVNHPPHYERDGAIECIDEMVQFFGLEETMVFCKLNCFKYRYRAADKNGAEDIAKSDWYSRKFKQLLAIKNKQDKLIEGMLPF